MIKTRVTELSKRILRSLATRHPKVEIYTDGAELERISNEVTTVNIQIYGRSKCFDTRQPGRLKRPGR